MAEPWYCQIDGKQYGPATPAQLKKLADSGRLKKTDFLRQESKSAWTPAGNFAALWGASTTSKAPATAPARPAPQSARKPPPVVTTYVAEVVDVGPRGLNVPLDDLPTLAPLSPAAPPVLSPGRTFAPATPIPRRKAPKKSESNAKYALLSIPAVIVAAVVAALQAFNIAGGFSSVEEYLKRDSERTNRTLPKLITPDVRCDRTSAGPGRRVTFYYTLIDVDEVDSTVNVANLSQTMKTEILREFRRAPEMAYFRRNKVEMVMVVRDNRQRHITTIRISPGEW